MHEWNSNHQRKDRHSRKDKVSEKHRLLYIQETVFPDKTLCQTRTSNAPLTIKAGHYSWPFCIRFPLMNNCTSDNQPQYISNGRQKLNSTINTVQNIAVRTGLSGITSSLTGIATSLVGVPSTHGSTDETIEHITEILPPSLAPIENSSIKYFIKVTIRRPAFYKANLRNITPIVFCPIEPEQEGDDADTNNSLVFVRKQCQVPQAGPSRGLFSIFKRKTYSSGPDVVFEARLPNPPILHVLKPLPLQLLVIREFPKDNRTIIVRSLIVKLIVHTLVKAEGFQKNFVTVLELLRSPPVTSIKVPGHKAVFELSKEIPKITIPDSVPPNFKTCNIERMYQLAIQVSMVSGDKGTELITELITDVTLNSGYRATNSPTSHNEPSVPLNNTTSASSSSQQQQQQQQQGIISTDPHHGSSSRPGNLKTHNEDLPSYDEATELDSRVTGQSQNTNAQNVNQRRQYTMGNDYFADSQQWDID